MVYLAEQETPVTAALLRRLVCEDCGRQLDAPAGVDTHDGLDPDQLAEAYAEPEAGLTPDLTDMCRGRLLPPEETTTR